MKQFKIVFPKQYYAMIANTNAVYSYRGRVMNPLSTIFSINSSCFFS